MLVIIAKESIEKKMDIRTLFISAKMLVRGAVSEAPLGKRDKRHKTRNPKMLF